jgi:hypothetical protein
MPPSGVSSFTPPIEQTLIGQLTRSFASTSSYRKSRYSIDAIARLAQRIERFAQPESQRADHARSHHRDAGSAPFLIRIIGFSHFSTRKN